MLDIKLILAIVILAIGVPYLVSIAAERLFKFRLPHFLKENSSELSIIAAASCVMGFVLMVF